MRSAPPDPLEEWKRSSIRWNAENPNPDDKGVAGILVDESSIVPHVLDYFLDHSCSSLVFPAKTYAVALIYAWALGKKYGLAITDVLSDPDLFVGSPMPWFKTLTAANGIYELILSLVDLDEVCEETTATPQVKATLNYFMRESSCC